MDDQLQRQPDYYDWLKKGCEKAVLGVIRYSAHTEELKEFID